MIGGWRYVRVVVFAIALVALLLSSCTAETTENSVEGALPVTVSIVPQQYFVERIGGEHVIVTVMVGPGDNPVTYEPKPDQLKALSQSVAYFSIGVPFETAWLEKIAGANPDMRLVDTIAGIDRHPMEAHHHEDDADDHSSEEISGAPDPHVWVSPELVKVQALTIYEALAEIDPDHAADYAANYEAFVDDIDALIVDVQETLAGVAAGKFMVFHPSWGYFAEEFGLEQIAIEIGGQEPSARELVGLIEAAQEEGVLVVFAQPEFSTSDAETIAEEIGGEVLLISPLAYDWLGNLRAVAGTFAAALSE